jgi:hypothetical protein
VVAWLRRILFENTNQSVLTTKKPQTCHPV